MLVDPLSPDGALPASRARIPGSLHEYTRLPTGPLDMPVTTAGPDADSIGPAVPTDALWHPAPTPMSVRRGHLGEWSLMAAIVSLVASFFVGWALPIALIAVVLAAVAIRRPTESRGVSGWALALGLVATVYSVGWLVYATTQLW